eukprot:scaffold16752_cov85-Cyclotella_meneghiniana.AAC.8
MTAVMLGVEVQVEALVTLMATYRVIETREKEEEEEEDVNEPENITFTLLSPQEEIDWDG